MGYHDAYAFFFFLFYREIMGVVLEASIEVNICIYHLVACAHIL